MSENAESELILVGYTNGAQILYANDSVYGEQGAFYKTAEHNCLIPLYMLRSHYHRIESTTDGQVTLDMIEEAKRK